MRSEVFRVTFPDGHFFVGRIQGSGGCIGAETPKGRERQLSRLRAEVERASQGVPLASIYEPHPGYCHGWSYGTDCPQDVPLAGAVVEWVD